ncbi:unnamed protein product [Caenorhabditis angaria]|uniref:Phlebovirus glycoprotein G2 fusion domain-containing protein n=1 Tax=Caenorhabditis angaria TaxID=860376 RepID=A0A9P1J3V1_9PELO|nr:unnamed protein product [Caenorhabditis angaria]
MRKYSKFIIGFIIFNCILLTTCEDQKITCHRVIHNKKGSCEGNFCYSQILKYNKTTYVRKGCIDYVNKKHLTCRKITSDLVVNEELCYCDKKCRCFSVQLLQSMANRTIEEKFEALLKNQETIMRTMKELLSKTEDLKTFTNATTDQKDVFSKKRSASSSDNERKHDRKHAKFDESAQNNHKNKKCILCEEYGHLAVACKTYPTLINRKMRIAVLNRCPACLMHSASIPCRTVPQKCRHCEEGRNNHPTALCPTLNVKFVESRK